MRKVIRTLAFLLVLALLGGGGFYLYREHFAPRPGPQAVLPAPEPAPAPTPDEAPILTDGTIPTGEAIATLAATERSVKMKRASDLAWNDAQAETALFENDAVRTFEKASASIAFGPDDIVEVDQNALVIIKARRKEENAISLALLSGDFIDGLEARPEAERAGAIAQAAEKRQVTIRPAAGALPGQKTRVAVKTLADKSTSVAAVKGSLRVVAPGGKEIVLKEKMVTKISEAGIVAQPRLLPGVPALSFPADGATYSFQRKVPRVDMTWKPAERARRYRVVVSNDPGFRKIFADDRVDGTALSIKNLQPGSYYWRVRAQDADGFEGPYSDVRSVKAVYDDAPPALTILAPPEMFVSPKPAIELKGRTEQGARVKVNGQRVPVGPDGTFAFPLPLKEGVNLVSIEAVDAAGNSEYGRRLITYKGSKRSTASVAGE